MTGTSAASTRLEQRAVTALVLGIFALVVALGAFVWWLVWRDFNYTVFVGTAVLGAVAVSMGDSSREAATGRAQAAVVVSTLALVVCVAQMLTLISAG